MRCSRSFLRGYGARLARSSSAQGVEASRRASPDVPGNPREACCGKTTAFCGNTTPGITIGSPGTSPSAVATLCTDSLMSSTAMTMAVSAQPGFFGKNPPLIPLGFRSRWRRFQWWWQERNDPCPRRASAYASRRPPVLATGDRWTRLVKFLRDDGG